MTKRLIARRLDRPVDASWAFETLFHGAAAAFWLDSSDASGWSYLGQGEPLAVGPGGVLDALAGALEEAGAADGGVDVSAAPEGMAFRLGWVGRLDYELWRRTAARHPDPVSVGLEEWGAGEPGSDGVASEAPGGAFLAADRMLALDHGSGDAWLVAFDTADGIRWLDEAERALGAAPTDITETGATDAAGEAAWRHSDAEYLALIDRCRAAIRAGDAYQLCLTNAATVPGRFDPLEVHRRLRRLSPAPHAGLLRLGEATLVSASPERFLRVTPDGVATTRPIKGTRKRGAGEREDERLRRELIESDKERAENLMIVDLMRNDLSRVCRLGSVHVTGLLQVESYAQVHQLVSTVEGTLRKGATAVDAVRALFPAGSMTGAPKLRAIEILEGLERGPRGMYAGAFGYLGVDGALDLAMVIRSIVIDPAGAAIGAGGGITTLSDPAEELEEVHLKAAPLFRALGIRDPSTPEGNGR